MVRVFFADGRTGFLCRLFAGKNGKNYGEYDAYEYARSNGEIKRKMFSLYGYISWKSA
jgi:hypothetical protein